SGVYPTLSRLMSWQAPHTAVTICLPAPSGKSWAWTGGMAASNPHAKAGRSCLYITDSLQRFLGVRAIVLLRGRLRHLPAGEVVAGRSLNQGSRGSRRFTFDGRPWTAREVARGCQTPVRAR